jgi:hypothetical protein
MSCNVVDFHRRFRGILVLIFRTDFHPENEGSRFLQILEPVYLTTLSYPGSDFDSHHHDSLKAACLIAELKPCFTLMADLKILSFRAATFFKYKRGCESASLLFVGCLPTIF